MIIVRTPLRASFFGGGTDHPQWFCDQGRGVVLSSAINKYVYIQLRHLPAIFPFQYRVVWPEVEQVEHVHQIRHPVVRQVLEYYGKDDSNGYEIVYNADLPARSGLGSSSAFTVACLHAFQCHRGHHASPRHLAQMAIHLEQDLLKEPVGCQDQVAVAVGGLNRIEFHQDRTFTITPAAVSAARYTELQSSLLMFFTGFTRDAGTIEQAKTSNFAAKRGHLARMAEMADEGLEILQDPKVSLQRFGALLDEAWHLKRGLAAAVSSAKIDAMYDRAIAAGAVGGKLLGAGGGGFFLFFAPPQHHARIIEALSEYVYVPVNFERQGSQVIMFDPHLTSNYQTKMARPLHSSNIGSFREL